MQIKNDLKETKFSSYKALQNEIRILKLKSNDYNHENLKKIIKDKKNNFKAQRTSYFASLKMQLIKEIEVINNELEDLKSRYPDEENHKIEELSIEKKQKKYQFKKDKNYFDDAYLSGSVDYFVKSFLGSTNRCISYMFSSTFKSFRTYVYSFIIPLFFTMIIYFWNSGDGANQLRPPIIASYSIIPSFSIMFLVSFILCDWRKSVFLKQLNNMKLNKFQFLLSFFVVVLVIGLISSIINVLFMICIEIGFKEKSVIESWFAFCTKPLDWFMLIYCISITIAISFTFSLLISGSIKSIFLIQTINIALLIVIIFGCDIFFDPDSISGDARVLTIIDYFIPQSYCVWNIFMVGSEAYLYSENVAIITPSIVFDNLAQFTAFWQCQIGSLLWLITLSISSYFLLKFSNK